MSDFTLAVILTVYLLSVGQIFKLELEYKKEVDNLKRKYDALIQDTEKEFVKKRKEIEMMYTKVSKHQELAVGFREIFDETMEEAGSAYQGMKITTIISSIYLVSL